MIRNPYISPTTRLLSTEFDTVFCLSILIDEPFEDEGDYEWDEWDD